MRVAWLAIRRGVYAAILVAVVMVLLRQGIEPWVVLISHPWVFLGVMVVTGVGIFVQAYTFRLCLPPGTNRPGMSVLVLAWSAGGVTGFVAPLFAGLAMRMAVLKSAGVSVGDSAAGTLRQIVFNVEYALLAAATILLIYQWEPMPELGLVLSLCWILWWWFRRTARSRTWLLPKKVRKSAGWLLAPPQGILAFWLFGLLGLMSVNYHLVYTGFGIDMALYESILLASLTVLTSLIVLIPNGLGVLEGLWITVAMKQGLSLTDSVGLALLLRLGYLFSAGLLWGAISMTKSSRDYE